MVCFSGTVDMILDIIEEAKNRGYSELVLKQDLNNFINRFYKEQSLEYDEELRWASEDSYDEGKEDGYSEGHSDGYDEGKEETKEELINQFANAVIELKEFIRNNSLSQNELQLKITEMLLKLDDDNNIHYSKEEKLEVIDNEVLSCS